MKFIFFIYFFSIFSCTPGSSSSLEKETNLSKRSNTSESKSNPNSADEEEDDVSLPFYDRLSTGTCFNQNCSSSEVSSDKIFDAVRVDFYQPIYVDFQQEGFPGWGGKINRQYVELDYPPTGASATFTLWQPDASGAEDVESLLAGEYYSILGYYAKNFDVSKATSIENMWAASGEGTLVLKLKASAVKEKEELMWSVAPPKEYNMVQYVEGNTYEDLVVKCQDQVYMLHTPGIFLCPIVQSTQYSSTTVNKDTGRMSIEMSKNLYKNLTIWQPVPEPGYQCLGYIATNDLSQPYMKAYGGGQISSMTEGSYLQKYIEIFSGSFESLSQGWFDSPMMCVNQTYLTQGKYGDVITWTKKTLSDGTEKRFLIVKVEARTEDDYGYNSNEVGIGSTNLFVTLEDLDGGMTIEEQYALCNGPNYSESCPVWVLNSQYVNIKTFE
jgi:hypothetical protein